MRTIFTILLLAVCVTACEETKCVCAESEKPKPKLVKPPDYHIDQKFTHLGDGKYCMTTDAWHDNPIELLSMTLVYDGYPKRGKTIGSIWVVPKITESIKKEFYALADSAIANHKRITPYKR